MRCGCFRCMQINKLLKKTIIRIFLGVSRQFDHITLTFLITTLTMLMKVSIFLLITLVKMSFIILISFVFNTKRVLHGINEKFSE